LIGCSVLLLLLPACASLSAQGLTEHRLQHDGRQRTYLMHRPARSERAAHPRALVLVLHGGGTAADSMVRLTHGRFNELADRDNAVVVYPQGIDHAWNDGRDPSASTAHRDQIDDVEFLRAVIREAAVREGVDPARVFATGISNGGMMALRLGCEQPEVVRAVAPLTASIPTPLKPVCQHATRVGLLLMNGTEDPLVPYGGGEIRLALFGRGKSRGEVLGTEEAVALWANHAGCPQTAQRSSLPDLAEDGTRITRESYGPCSSGARVELYRVDGGGHTWPGGRQYLPEFVVGRTSRDINACDVIWEFFRSF
jgi:polyhydroxybutyrate depolymerase